MSALPNGMRRALQHSILFVQFGALPTSIIRERKNINIFFRQFGVLPTSVIREKENTNILFGKFDVLPTSAIREKEYQHFVWGLDILPTPAIRRCQKLKIDLVHDMVTFRDVVAFFLCS